MAELTCFKAYDIRGQLDVEMDASIAYRIGRAVSQHFKARLLVVGWDARETSPELAKSLAQGAQDAGTDVINIGLAGTEEVYWAVTEFSACAGIEVTASHNPINYNGMKIIKSGSRPLDGIIDFQAIKELAETEEWVLSKSLGSVIEKSKIARLKYVERILSFINVSALNPLKVIVNAGNGAAGPTIDAIVKELEKQGAQLELIRIKHEPDCSFPNGIPNPLLTESHPEMEERVKRESGDLGIAFDGDYDRCFFFDETGKFVSSEYVVGLLASIFLDKEYGARIVHDPRVVFNTRDIVNDKGGVAIQSKTGHVIKKQKMRESDAIYGGEISAHHYFRDFAFCGSGMIPWLLIVELISTSGKSLGALMEHRSKCFSSSGEHNFKVSDADQVIASIIANYSNGAHLDMMDGVSLTFEDWRLNVRKSNTESLVRLNIESRGNRKIIKNKLKQISNLIYSLG